MAYADTLDAATHDGVTASPALSAPAVAFADLPQPVAGRRGPATVATGASAVEVVLGGDDSRRNGTLAGR